MHKVGDTVKIISLYSIYWGRLGKIVDIEYLEYAPNKYYVMCGKRQGTYLIWDIEKVNNSIKFIGES